MSIFDRVKVPDPSLVPKDSQILSKIKIIGFFDVVIESWKPQSDVWTLKYGSFVMGFGAALSGWYGNNYFRRRLKLRNHGFSTTYLANTTLPFLIANVFHATYIKANILGEPLECILCLETKAATVQLLFGLMQPLLMVPLASMMFATRHFTQRIPSPIHHRKDFWRFCKQLYTPLKRPMLINGVLQIGLATLVTHLEVREFLYINQQMRKPKEELEVQEKD